MSLAVTVSLFSIIAFMIHLPFLKATSSVSASTSDHDANRDNLSQASRLRVAMLVLSLMLLVAIWWYAKQATNPRIGPIYPQWAIASLLALALLFDQGWMMARLRSARTRMDEAQRAEKQARRRFG